MLNKAREISIVRISELKPNPKNRNIHSKEQIDRLADIIKYQGFRSPIVVSNQSGFIVMGHGRLEAAKQAGIKEVPVIYQDFDSPEMEYSSQISDNAVALWAELDLSSINTDLAELGPDFDIDLLGIKNFTLDVAEKEALTDEDEIPEPKETRVKRGDIWKLGNHRLMCGDSTMIDDVEKLMNGEKAEILFTDPPYGISYQSNYRKEKFDKLSNDDVVLQEWVGCAEASVSGWVIFFIGWQRMSEWLKVGDAFGKLTNILIWKKAAAMGDLTGSFSPTYELALAYNRGAKLANGAGRPSAIIECNIDSAEKFVHPTQKPIALINKIIDSVPSVSILDLFGGSGSTLIACEKTNRKCFMMELDEKYCDVILTRWENYTGKKAELING